MPVPGGAGGDRRSRHGIRGRERWQRGARSQPAARRDYRDRLRDAARRSRRGTVGESQDWGFGGRLDDRLRRLTFPHEDLRRGPRLDDRRRRRADRTLAALWPPHPLCGRRGASGDARRRLAQRPRIRPNADGGLPRQWRGAAGFRLLHEDDGHVDRGGHPRRRQVHADRPRDAPSALRSGSSSSAAARPT